LGNDRRSRSFSESSGTVQNFERRNARKPHWSHSKVPIFGTIGAILITALGIYAGTVASSSSAGAASAPPRVLFVPGSSPDAAAVQSLEDLAVQHVLDTHNLPASDADAVRGWARDEVRADAFALLLQIIEEGPQARSVGGSVLGNGADQLVYDWFQGQVQQQNIQAAKDAINEYLRWSGHTSINDDSAPVNKGPLQSFNHQTPVPTGFCNFLPPSTPDGNGPFDGTYSAKKNQVCFTPCTDVLTECAPDYPSPAQFLAWGKFDASYGTNANAENSFAGLTGGAGAALESAFVQEFPGHTNLETPFAYDVEQGRVALATSNWIQGVVGSDLTSAIDGILTGVVDGAHVAELALMVLNVAEGLQSVLEFAGPIGTAMEFYATTIIAIYHLVENAKVAPELRDALAAAQSSPPDLFAELGENDGGFTLFSTFIDATAPYGEALVSNCRIATKNLCDNAPPPPARNPQTDPSFVVTPWGSTQGTATGSITTFDPLGTWDNTYLSGNGWFVTRHCTGPHLQGCGPAFQSLSMTYTDPLGNHWMAERIKEGNQPTFAIVPLDQSNRNDCSTILPNGSSACISPTIWVWDDNNQFDSISLAPASTLAPNVTTSVQATPGNTQVAFAATATDPGNTALSYHWVFPDNTTSDSASATWTAPGAGEYSAQLVVTNAAMVSTTVNVPFAVSENTHIDVAVSPATSVVGQPVTVNAFVQHATIAGDGGCSSSQPGAPPVSGEVQFFLGQGGQTPYGQPVPLRDPSQDYCPPNESGNGYGVASITLPPDVAGARFVLAQFLPNPLYTGSHTDEAGVEQQIVPAATSVAVTPSATVIAPGQPVTLSAAVTPIAPGVGLPTGSVQFTDGTQVLGPPVALDGKGIATSPPITSLTDGAVQAHYSGDTNFLGATGGASVQLGAVPTTTTVTSSANPSTTGAPVVFSAKVSAPSGIPTGTVQFSVDGVALGTPVALDNTGTAASPPDSTLPMTGKGTPFPSGHTVTADYSFSCNSCVTPDFLSSTGTLISQKVGDFGVVDAVLPPATPGSVYGPVTLQATLVGASSPPYTTTLKWQKVGLPKGLTLSSAGVLSGTPNMKLSTGVSSVAVQVTETVTTLNGTHKVKTQTTVSATFPFYLIGPGANLAGANLAGAQLQGVNLSSANLSNAIVYGANLTGANLAGATATQAIMVTTNLTNANLSNVNFTSANFVLANLTGANLTGASVIGAVWASTTCPDGVNSDTVVTKSCAGHGV